VARAAAGLAERPPSKKKKHRCTDASSSIRWHETDIRRNKNKRAKIKIGAGKIFGVTLMG